MLKRQRGFTLIEIVLVLAIAGLLLVIVFLAVSGAQKSRRDTQRKHDLARLASQVETYKSNTGSYPRADGSPSGFMGGFESSYLPNSFSDPLAGSGYDLRVDFAACDPTHDIGSHGPGSISYDIPGGTDSPYKLRMCLEQGEFYIGN